MGCLSRCLGFLCFGPGDFRVGTYKSHPGNPEGHEFIAVGVFYVIVGWGLSIFKINCFMRLAMRKIDSFLSEHTCSAFAGG